MHISIMNLENLDEVKAEIEEGGSVAATDAAAAVATEFVEGPEEALAAADKVGDEIDSLQASAEQATAVGDKIEEMQEGLAKVVEQDGGLTPASAEVVQLGLEALREALCMPALTKVLPTFEQYGDKATQQEATLNLEAGFVDTLKTIWAAIVSAAIAIKNKLKDFFAALFDGAERTRQRAVKLAAVAKSRSGGKPSADAKVKINGGVLNVDGTVVAGSAFLGKLKEHYKTTQVGAQNQVLAGFKEAGQKMIKAVGLINDEDKYNEMLFDAMSDLTKTSENEVGKKFVFGQVGIVAVENTGLIAKVKPVSISIKKLEAAKEVKTEEVSPLTADEAFKACNEISEHLAGYKNVAEVVKRVNEIMDGVTAAAKAGAAAASKAKDEKSAAAANDIRKASSQLLANTNMVVTSLRRHDLQVTGAALDYIANSLKTVKGKGDGKPENLLPAPDKQSKAETLALK